MARANPADDVLATRSNHIRRSLPWLFPHNPVGKIWEREFFDALDAGDITKADLAAARRCQGVGRRICFMARLPHRPRSVVNSVWRSLEQLRPRNWLSDAMDRLVRSFGYDVTWHWKQNPTALRRLRWILNLLPDLLASPRQEVIFLGYSQACRRPKKKWCQNHILEIQNKFKINSGKIHL